MEGGTVVQVPQGRWADASTDEKTVTIAACPHPRIKKEVRWFLGLAWLLPLVHFAELTCPLSILTKRCLESHPVDGEVPIGV